MRIKHYNLKIKPVAWKRAGRNGNVYYDAQKADKDIHAFLLKQIQGNHQIFANKPLLLRVTFWIEIPKSKRSTIKEGDYHYIRPDNSNFVKFIEDAMNKITIEDDCLFAGLISFKRWAKTPSLDITIEELD